MKSLESQPDLAYEKISKLLKLDFLLNGVHEKVENQTLNLDVFFDVFIFWLDYPVQSILIDGISDIIEHNKYTTSNNEILVALGNTCYNLLKYSFPAMLSEIDSCENVLNWVNDQIYSNLSVLPGFDRFQILREKLNESETLNTVRKFLAALNERKINRKYIVDVAFKVSYSIHLSNFIEGKDKNLLSILCGMLKFLRNFFIS